MGAVLFRLTSKYWTSISGEFTGFVWDVVANAGRKAQRHAEIAANYQQAGKWSVVGFGGKWRNVDNRLNQSVNIEATQSGGQQ